MPGTVGALWGLPLAWGIQHVPGWGWQAAVIAALLALGIPLCTAAARRLGGKDPSAVVWDEISTMPIVFFLVPLDFSQVGWITLVAGFALHRLFDITKVPPARQLERLPEGLGIMADDVAAAIYARIALQGVIWILGLGA